MLPWLIDLHRLLTTHRPWRGLRAVHAWK